MQTICPTERALNKNKIDVGCSLFLLQVAQKVGVYTTKDDADIVSKLLNN